jgi:hypothetical protein
MVLLAQSARWRCSLRNASEPACWLPLLAATQPRWCGGWVLMQCSIHAPPTPSKDYICLRRMESTLFWHSPAAKYLNSVSTSCRQVGV